jgi:hypothetical protein
MTLHLRSIEHGPVSLPIWETILEDLGNPPAARIAKVLGLGVSTVHRYRQLGRAPRSCQLALFWLTRWGQSLVHTNAVNDCTTAVSYVRALRDQVAGLEAQVSHLAALGQSGAANDPLLRGPHA